MVRTGQRVVVLALEAQPGGRARRGRGLQAAERVGELEQSLDRAGRIGERGGVAERVREQQRRVRTGLLGVRCAPGLVGVLRRGASGLFAGEQRQNGVDVPLVPGVCGGTAAVGCGVGGQPVARASSFQAHREGAEYDAERDQDLLLAQHVWREVRLVDPKGDAGDDRGHGQAVDQGQIPPPGRPRHARRSPGRPEQGVRSGAGGNAHLSSQSEER